MSYTLRRIATQGVYTAQPRIYDPTVRYLRLMTDVLRRTTSHPELNLSMTFGPG
jgi:hypothetical protein